MSTPILELKKVSKIFDAGKPTQITAVKDVSFQIQPGQSVGIVGESGSGKSTLARMVMGLTDVTEGSIFLEGKDITNLSRRKMRPQYAKLQMVFQDPYSVFSPRMPVGTFLEEGLVYMKGMSRREAARESQKLMGWVELPAELLNRLPHQLSGGQLQRVAIARAISVSPGLLVLDEATSALDVSVQKQILALLARLKKELKLSYLVIGHDLAVVRTITDRIEVMQNAQIIETLPSIQLTTTAHHPYTRTLLSSVYSLPE